jgi:hypothetical protein
MEESPKVDLEALSPVLQELREANQLPCRETGLLALEIALVVVN